MSRKDAEKIKAPFRVERVNSDDPLMARWLYTCCGYEHSEPLCVPGYVRLAKFHCPKCGERMLRYGKAAD